MRSVPLFSLAIALACCSGGPAKAVLCAQDQVPAASLLIPYFEVGIACGDGSGERNTRFTLTNTTRDAVLARVTMWTNAGIPGFTFDIYLNGFDQQDVDLRSVFCSGWLPSTGSALPPGPGSLSEPAVAFSGCNATTTPGGAPVYGGNGALPAMATSVYRAAYSGQPLPNSPGNCAAVANGRGTADGYITIDSVNRCGAIDPGSTNFGNDLAAGNSLIASAILLDDARNASVAMAAVALEATAGSQLNAARSFYASGGLPAGPRRESLPPAWSVEAGRTAFSSSDLVVWRSPPGPGSAFSCAAGPSWYPLQTANDTGFGSRGVFHVRDDGSALTTTRTAPFPVMAQRVDAATELPELQSMTGGWTYMNLSDGLTAAPFPSQAWVGVIRRSAGRFDILEPGLPQGASCDGAGFGNTSPGPLQTYAGDPP